MQQQRIKAPTDSYNNLGAVVALTHKGHQDKWMEENHTDHGRRYFNAHAQLIGDKRYHVTYAELKSVNTWKNDKRTLVLTVKPTCDLINEVDIHLPIIRPPGNALDRSLNETLERIDVYYGGFRIDALNTDDIDMQLRMNCDIWKRKITFNEHDDTVVIPLLMAPFYATNLVFPSTSYHDLKIEITFRGRYLDHPRIRSILTSNDRFLTLYANAYYLNESDHDVLYNQQHHIVTFQNQFTGKEMLKKGENIVKFLFNHPMYLIYCWGFNMRKVKNVKVLLEDKTYYDGPIAPLIHKQRQRGISREGVLTIFFSPDDVGTPTMSSANFSRLDKACLVIDTDEDHDMINVIGINMQPMMYINGMVGLVYAK